MSEMSLRQQIEQIEQLRKNLYEILREFNEMETKLNDRIRYIRQTGMRTETADKMQDKYLREITEKRDKLCEIMSAEERFLIDLEEELKTIFNV